MLKRDPDRTWSTDALVAEMRASTLLVSEVLRGLEAGGLARREPDGTFRFAPAGATLASLSDQLESAYRERPVTVVKAILSAPNEKLQNFADAFRLKGDPK